MFLFTTVSVLTLCSELILLIPKLDQLGATLMNKEAHLQQVQRDLALAQTSSEENLIQTNSSLQRLKEVEKLMKEKELDYANSFAVKNAR